MSQSEEYKRAISTFTKNLMLHIVEQADKAWHEGRKDELVEHTVEVSGEMIYNGCKALMLIMNQLKVPQAEREHIKRSLREIIDTSFEQLGKLDEVVDELQKKMRGSKLN